jgi:hypothetical protein
MVTARSRAAGGKSMVDLPTDHHTRPPRPVTDNSLALGSGQIMCSRPLSALYLVRESPPLTRGGERRVLTMECSVNRAFVPPMLLTIDTYGRWIQKSAHEQGLKEPLGE